MLGKPLHWKSSMPTYFTLKIKNCHATHFLPHVLDQYLSLAGLGVRPTTTLRRSRKPTKAAAKTAGSGGDRRRSKAASIASLPASSNALHYHLLVVGIKIVEAATRSPNIIANLSSQHNSLAFAIYENPATSSITSVCLQVGPRLCL